MSMSFVSASTASSRHLTSVRSNFSIHSNSRHAWQGIQSHGKKRARATTYPTATNYSNDRTRWRGLCSQHMTHCFMYVVPKTGVWVPQHLHFLNSYRSSESHFRTHCDTPHPKNKGTCSCKLALRGTIFHIRLQSDQCTSIVSADRKRSIPEWRPAREDALSPNRQREGTVWCPHGERTCPLLTPFYQHAAAKGLMPTL
jgi:hypothetical protein